MRVQWRVWRGDFRNYRISEKYIIRVWVGPLNWEAKWVGNKIKGSEEIQEQKCQSAGCNLQNEVNVTRNDGRSGSGGWCRNQR